MRRLATLCLALAAACGHDTSPAGKLDMAVASDADLSTGHDLAGIDMTMVKIDMSPPGLGCIENTSYCSQWNERSYCDTTPTGPVMKKESCAAGCYQGVCSQVACADECTLGTTSNLGTCKLWDVGTGAFVTADQAKLHDRARAHDAQTQAITATALGAMINPAYTDATHTTLNYYWGTGDAALWSGSWLAGQAWRLLATGSRDAADQVAAKVAMLHDWFRVTGDVGYVARLAVPRAAAVPLEFNYMGQSYCDREHHCNIDFKGAKWDWIGGLSRDAYTGVMLGLGQAYLASPDESVRAMIREDVTTVALELAKSRTFPVVVSVNGVPFNSMVTLENVILAPSEYINGKVQIALDTGNTSDATIAGMREFLPDFDTLVKQVIPLIAIPIQRPSSAMMLGGFFAIAMRASKGVPGYEATYNTLKTYYEAHVDDWIANAVTWSFNQSCTASYFGNHIAYISLFSWALLEENQTRRATITNAILDGRMWQALKLHKNSYFAYLWGGTRLMSMPPDMAAITDANTQLAGFMYSPKGIPPVNHLADYPHDTACQINGQDGSAVAVDVKDRRMDDSIWQRGVWTLYDAGWPETLLPATDYVGAYWAARRFGLMADDHAGSCTRWAQ